jgi:hypothetical protein
MRNAGIVTNGDIDFSKTRLPVWLHKRLRRTCGIRSISSNSQKKSGDSLEAVAVHDASTDECSMTLKYL